MPKSKVPLILESRVSLPNGDNIEKFGKACPQSVVRRKLSDISNLPQNHRPLIQDETLNYHSVTAKEHIEQLQKENTVLVKMLAQRNKLLEQSGSELERMKVNLIKVQQQNQQLAQAHTQMLAELNSGKDKLKALNHELRCKSALLTSINSVPKINSSKFHEEGESIKECSGDEKLHTTKRKLRSLSLNPSEPVQSEENTVKKRPSTRRQSARFKAAELKSSEELPEIVNVAKSPKCPSPDNPVHEDTSTSATASIQESKHSSDVDSESQVGSRRSSMFRPSRLAAKKVQSYKEVPLNIKMRRAE